MCTGGVGINTPLLYFSHAASENQKRPRQGWELGEAANSWWGEWRLLLHLLM